jgi:hypothetical protein
MDKVPDPLVKLDDKNLRSKIRRRSLVGNWFAYLRSQGWSFKVITTTSSGIYMATTKRKVASVGSKTRGYYMAPRHRLLPSLQIGHVENHVNSAPQTPTRSPSSALSNLPVSAAATNPITAATDMPCDLTSLVPICI